MRALTLQAPPAEEPLTASEALGYLREDQTTEEALVDGLIRSAREQAERYTDRALISQTWQLFLDDWPAEVCQPWWDGVRQGPITEVNRASHLVELPKPPLIAVDHVKTYDDADAATLWAASNYFVDTAREPGRLIRRLGVAWPIATRTANGIEIQFQAGYGASGAAVPAAIRRAMLAMVGYLFERRGDDDLSAEAALERSGARALLDPFRVVAL